ncbi:MAG: FAD-dependent oxidoreductase [Prolixibacteraceae bacterium]|jgi:glutamate synthase (NADPH) small chain|nr:FAD-dependent oxidoreductase [Prolixibacteraceae bacterium]MBT6766600.1 FAD-dependent oxidoreductase [Prolixibacteraceae bacterium]MBT6998307.1 FAD-dependent oxidoreductase [Prolixibacteraceae bacterium]MBT7396447.1 FAD-dependent oxidoreductase [Prolixibacteraceae bacterium]
MSSIKDILTPFTAWKNVFKEPVTIKDPLNDRPGAERYRGFHKNDVQECIGCGTCESICENEAIDMVAIAGFDAKDGDSGLRPSVDYGRCCWCALCVDVCTTGSLTLSNEYTWVDTDPDNFRFVPGVDAKSWDKNELGWKKPAGNYEFYGLKRVEMGELHPEERDSSFIEMIKGYSKEQAEKEADRCVECGICTATCPAHMGIPEYIKAIRNDDLEEGLRILYDTNPLPEICGRICTHKCETVCSIGHRGEPLSIRWLKRYIADQNPSEKYKTILESDNLQKNGKKIAIIGSGPAGLSAAHYLALMGYEVEIFEKLAEAGGMMRYGIPEYRLPYDQIDKDINYILSLGVKIHYNTTIGKDITLEKLGEDFDAVFAGTGLHLGRSTRIEGTDHENVYQSIELLRKITEGEEIHVPEKIVVIGGGNVAMDITRSLARLQKIKYGKVQVIATSLETEEKMPADREEVVEAREEMAVVNPGWSPQRIEIVDGKIKGLHVVQCLSLFDETGNFNPQCNMDNANFFEADMVVESIGQGMDLSYITEDVKEHLEMGPRGRIRVDDYFQTSVPWLFMGGDTIQGPDVIHGIANGHKAALGIDKMLIGD